MTPLSHWLALALAAQTAPVTPEQAQTMPVAELARAVLGPAGAAVVRVKRPVWPECGWMCPPTTPAETEQRKRAPPLTPGIAFYQRPVAASPAGSDWTGLCTSAVIHVGFDEANQVTGVRMSNWYGVPDGMVRTSGNLDRDFAAAQNARDRKCAAWSTDKGFYADSEESAHRAAAAVTLFREVAPRARALGIKVRCGMLAGDCTRKDQIVGVAALLSPARFGQVQQVRCADWCPAPVPATPDGCYSVYLTNDGESVLLQVADAHTKLRLVRVEYNQAQVVY